MGGKGVPADWPTAAASDFRVSRQRGEWVESDLAEYVTATVHPSSILRAETNEERRRAMRGFVEDLEKVAHVLNGGNGRG